jgi:hypothetical protein
VTSIFLSYRRQDAARAGEIAYALEAVGLRVWLDREGGDQASAKREAAVKEARCVIFLWTNASAGPAGGRARDEAARAHERGVLVPVRADKVSAPLVLPDVQVIDLAGWRASRKKDPFFADLVDAIRAKLDGREPLPGKGPAMRRRRLYAIGGVAAVAATVSTFFFNPFHVQDHFCAIPSGYVISDTCGAAGLGNRPTRGERLAWERRPRGDCTALAAFAADQRHYYHRIAAEMLTTAPEARADVFEPAPRFLVARVEARETPFPTEAQARAYALARAERDAFHEICAPRNAFEQLDGVEIQPRGFDCTRVGRRGRGGYKCQLDYHATCRIEARPLVKQCG